MVIRSERIVTPGGVVDGSVVVTDGRIDHVSQGGSAPDVDLGRRWLAPGYIDLHVHGGGGGQFNTTDPAEITAVTDFHARHGTTGLLATTVASPVEELEATVAAIVACDAPAILGIHLEGPFISPARPGAMDPSVFIDPSPEAVRRLLDAGRGGVRMMTLAPELDGGLDLVRSLADAGVIASVGHSDGSYEETVAGISAGVSSATHTFNAMPPLHHREPGVLGAVLDRDEVNCELILDGIHVAPATARLMLRVKGLAGVRLVTDAMSAAGMPDGDYQLGGAAVTVSGGRAVLASGDSIAGSTLTMDLAVANAVSWLGLSVPDAIALATENPARVLAVADRKGAIVPGLDADLVVLDDELAACATMIAGEWVHGSPA